MKLAFSGLTAAMAALLASCYPYPEPAPNPGPGVRQNNPEMPTDPQQDGRTTEGQSEPDQQNDPGEQEESGPTITDEMEDPAPPTESEEPENTIPVAKPVPGKPGYVFSPYNNKLIDVSDFPSGELVSDPHFPQSEKKYFRVP